MPRKTTPHNTERRMLDADEQLTEIRKIVYDFEDTGMHKGQSAGATIHQIYDVLRENDPSR